MKLLYFLLVLTIISLNSCKTTTEPVVDNNYLNSNINTDEFMSLHIGDIRQYSMPYSTLDTIYQVWKITDTAFRTDDTKVYICEWYTNSYNQQNRYIFYEFIRDGYLYSTELQKSSQYPGNPYFEQKLAAIKPHDGDDWIQTVGYYNPDSSQDHVTVNYLDELETPAGKFKDVFSLTASRGEPGSEVDKIYYTRYFGHVGYLIIGYQSSFLAVNYMKINGNEIGQYITMDSSVSKYSGTMPHFINPFGIKRY